jgi:hypothetical protein
MTSDAGIFPSERDAVVPLSVYVQPFRIGRIRLVGIFRHVRELDYGVLVLHVWSRDIFREPQRRHKLLNVSLT